MQVKSICALCVAIVAAAPLAAADPVVINFDTVMNNVMTSAIWDLVEPLGVLPPGFELDPATTDINGGFDTAASPVEMFPNGMLDSDEFALIAAILADDSFDATATGGTSHTEIYNAWNANFAQAWTDLGGGVGGPEVLLPPGAMIPDVEYLVTVMAMIGDADTMAFPVAIMDLVVHDDLARAIVGDPNIRTPDVNNYQRMYRYLGWCGDADGDGCSNLTEYEHFYPIGGRADYINAALDPAITPPGCTGDDRLCDGSGGVTAEYFRCVGLADLRATRTESQINFYWGHIAPVPSITGNSYSARWSALLTPDYSEVYTLHIRMEDGCRVWLDGQLIIDRWLDHGAASGVIPAPLVAGQPYPLKVEYNKMTDEGMAWLGWESASQPKQQIYEMNLTPAPGEGEGPDAYCGDQWIYNPATGHFYKITSTSMLWLNARNEATAEGGYLATVNDQAENDWIRSTFSIYGNIWIGANDIAQEGRWVWHENNANFWNGKGATMDPPGVPVPGFFTNWNGGGEPNDSSGEDYGEMYSNGKWNDNKTNAERFGVIEANSSPIDVTGPTPAGGWVTEGESIEFSVLVNSPNGSVSYQWFKDGAEIPGATSRTYLIASLTVADTGHYSCRVIDETPAEATTPTAYLQVFAEGELPLSGIAGLTALMGLCAIAGGLVCFGKSSTKRKCTSGSRLPKR